MGQIQGGYRGPDIVSDGLVLYLDAGSPNSYRTDFGTTWRDMSGGNRNYTLNGPVWDNLNNGRFYFDGTNDIATGPASNTFGFNYDVTIEVILNPTDYVGGSTFHFHANSVGGNRGYHAHTPYSDDFFWDVNGLTANTSRIQFNNGTRTFRNTIGHFVFRARSTTTPYRHIFRNNVSLVDSGASANSGNPLFSSTSAVIGGYAPFNEYFRGYIHLFRVYNRALSDNELTQNYNATRARFGL